MTILSPNQGHGIGSGNDDVAAASDPSPEDTIKLIIGSTYAPPLPPFTFWVESVCIALQAALLSFFALGYLNVVYEVP